MSTTSEKWSLTILAGYSRKWSQRLASEFQEGVLNALKEVEQQLRGEHPSLHLTPLYLTGADQAKIQLRESVAFAIFDVTDYDDDSAFLLGLMEGAGIPFVGVCRIETETGAKRGLRESDIITYKEVADLFCKDSLLVRRMTSAISRARVQEQLVYELWFPRDTATIWVVCPQCHDPGEFAQRSSPDYTYLDNLGDTDALLELMVFLSRYYPKASIEKFSSDDLPSSHTKDNMLVIGGPGSCEDISNRICVEMMSSMDSRISYSEDCELMFVAADGVETLELRADLRSDIPESDSADYFNVRRDYGYFARFANPVNENATVVLVSGIHTAGVLGSAKAFADRPEALRNYHSVFNTSANPRSFECYFSVTALNGVVRVPTIQADNIYSLGPLPPAGPNLAMIESVALEGRPVRILFIAGDRGGTQSNLIQIPREYKAIRQAIRSCDCREAFDVANPILAVSNEELAEAYRERAAILHFAGHGNDRSLSIISDLGLLVSQTTLVTDRLAAILKSFPDRVRLCVLNTCHSAAIAKHLVESDIVDAAIGWPASLNDATAIGFSQALYAGLGDGLSLSRAVSLATQSCGAAEGPLSYCVPCIDPDLFAFVERTQQ